MLCIRLNKQITRAILLVIFGLNFLFFSHASRAEGEQLYFIGMHAPVDSFSQKNGQNAAYLRWDEIEGQLPSDLSQFILLKNGDEVYTSPARIIVSPNEINLLYDGQHNAQRKSEMLYNLNQLAASELPPRLISSAAFATELAAKINDPANSFWNNFASRVDFNVARARGRGFLDSNPGNGLIEYELLGESITGQRVRLGLVVVNTDIVNSVPQASFNQVTEYARCDAPESGKSHGVVALNWNQTPSTNATDQYITGLITAGFDIYRSTQAGDVNQSLNIRDLAASRGFNQNGVPELPNLEKVNGQAIMVGGSAQRETVNQGWNPEFSKFLETYEDIKNAGLKPGDKRAYYLVARDFTGNYGATTGLEVTIPDTNGPPAPWDVHQITALSKDDNNAFRLRFSHVNMANYVKDNGYEKRWCNLDRARFDKKIKFVAESELCTSDIQREIDLDTSEYLIYRFDGIEQAKSFTDVDGDGYADIDERIQDANNPLLTSPGTACVANGPNLGPDNYLIGTLDTSDLEILDNGRAILDYQDSEPATNRGQVFWYRFATRGSDGVIGNLSAPVRGHFPDRQRGDRPYGPGVVGVKVCDYRVGLDSNIANEELVAADTTGDANWVRLSCDNGLGIGSNNSNGETTYPIRQYGAFRGARLNTQTCSEFIQSCENPNGTNVTYIGANGEELLRTTTFPLTTISQQQCPFPLGTVLSSNENSCDTRIIKQDEIIDPEDLTVTPPAGLTGCFNISRDIGGKPYRIGQYCAPFNSPIELPLDGLGGTSVCLSVSTTDENNEDSVPSQLPCFKLPVTETVGEPQIFQLGFENDSMIVDFRPPEQVVIGTIFDWYQKGSTGGRSSSFVVHSGNSLVGGSLKTTLDIDIAPEDVTDNTWQQEWCVRGRSVGTSPSNDSDMENLSNWSPELCGLRLPSSVNDPEYLPWPRVSLPPQMDDLVGVYLPIDGFPIIQLSDTIDFSNDLCQPTIPVCEGAKTDCVVEDDNSTQFLLCPDVQICRDSKANLANKLDFVVYRQTSESDPALAESELSDFVQVSPMIDHFSCADTAISDDLYLAQIDDPYIKLLNLGDINQDDLKASYLDKVPHILGNWYRYQLVYFDAKGEISKYRNTQWFQAN